MASTVLKTINSGTPAKENSQTATPPRITTSKIKRVGRMETKKYIAKINGMVSGKLIFPPKNSKSP